MAYVWAKDMIDAAKAGGYAVPAFNAENLEMVQAIVWAAEEKKTPVIIQTTPKTYKYLSFYQAVAMAHAEAERASVPVALHLDHCESYDDLMAAMDAGYTSVMIDASKLPFEENAELAKKVKKEAEKYGVSVEAELGTLGGKEDGAGAGVLRYTEVSEAKAFAEYTGVDYLAVAIGTAHGFYKGEPKLDFDRLGEIAKAVATPLVLHGGSGIPDESVIRCIKLGIAKLNVATELRDVATKVVREVLRDESVIDPKKYMGPARDAVKALCLHKIDICGSEGCV